jgi:hypothetical protein
MAALLLLAVAAQPESTAAMLLNAVAVRTVGQLAGIFVRCTADTNIRTIPRSHLQVIFNSMFRWRFVKLSLRA